MRVMKFPISAPCLPHIVLGVVTSLLMIYTDFQTMLMAKYITF